MKSITLTLLFICSTFFNINLISQAFSLPMENATWTYTIEGDGIVWTTQSFFPDSLVTVNNIQYAIINNIQLDTPPTQNWDNILYREQNKRVYVLPSNSLHEFLIYDFNLELGDTFVAKWGAEMDSDSIIYKVESVDTMISINNKSIKRIQLSNGNQGTIWYEGVGDFSWPFFYPHHKFGTNVSQSYNFHCLQSNNEVLFGIDNCSLISGTEDKRDEGIFIYPNPAYERIYIISTNVALEKVALYDIYGRKCKEIDSMKNSMEINCQGLNPGIYFVQIEANAKIIKTKKVLIK